MLLKLERAVISLESPWVALVGTPVPMILGKDYRALEKRIGKVLGIPCICFSTDGMNFYDYGQELAYVRLLQKFAEEEYETEKNHGQM
ncbi:hypothetical protein [Tissierella praeacuta]|uniref:hypothetical protein n=1 Tax=Tissierella praeacuta TaxID=43131 RepID=UPI003340D3E2